MIITYMRNLKNKIDAYYRIETDCRQKTNQWLLVGRKKERGKTYFYA